MIKKIFFLFFFCITLISCSHYGTRIRPSFSPIKLTTIMYRSMEEQLLFAGPINLKQNNGKDYIQFDYSALITNHKCDSVRCNFTVYTHNATFLLDTLFVKSDSVSKKISSTEKMYVNLNNKTYMYRYGFYISEKDFDLTLLSSKIEFIIGRSYTFISGKKWKKQCKEIKTKADMLRRTF